MGIMKKIVQVFLIGGFITLFTGFRPTEKKWEKSFARLDNEVKQNSKAYQTLGEATKSIGHRLTGSVNGEKAEEYAFQLLKSYGFTDVAFQPFEVEAWMRDTVTLSIAPGSSDNFREVPVVSLAHSPVEAKLQGEIVDVGNGLEEDFEAVKDRVKGKVVLANINLVGSPGKKNLHRSEKTALAIKYGATGVIMVNGAPGKILLTGTASVTGAIIGIPAVCISNDSGGELRKWLKEEGPLEAHIDMHNISKPIKARNVIATLKGKSDEKVIIGGHLDSWDLATGAHDDGAGVVAAMGVVETLKKLDYRPRRTIRVIAWMNEENGGRGGQAYFEAHKQALGKQYAAIEMDSGAGRPFGIKASVGPKAEKLFTPLLAALQPMGAHAFTRRDALGTGDLHRLETGGVPSFEPLVDSHSYFHYHHTPADTLDKVDPDNLKRNVALMSSLAWFLANIDGEIGRAPEQE